MKTSKRANPLAVFDKINALLHPIRGEMVLLDQDLARLFQVDLKELRGVLKKCPERFPMDFAFRLTAREAKDLGVGRAYAFTEAGAAMAAMLISAEAGVAIIRTVLSPVQGLLKEQNAITRMMERNDARFEQVFRLLNQARRTRGLAEIERPL